MGRSLFYFIFWKKSTKMQAGQGSKQLEPGSRTNGGQSKPFLPQGAPSG
jgi:hypothetical protein